MGKINHLKTGRIEIIAGGMFSGKSEELVRRLRRAVIARQNVQVFKPSADTRNSPNEIVTRDENRVDAVAVADSAELVELLDDDVEVVGMDEAQFFDEGLVAACEELADKGVRVIVAGLDMDYLRRPFGPMPGLMTIAEDVYKVHAVCVECGEAANYSHRIAGGQEQVEVGDTGQYKATCRRCYESYKP